MGNSKGKPGREVHNNKSLPKNDRNISNKQPNTMPTRTPGTTEIAQSKQKEGNNQDQSIIK